MNERTQEERLHQCISLTQQLRTYNLGSELSGMKIFSKATNEFIKNGTNYDDIIKFEEDPTIKLIVRLSRSRNVDCSVRIKRPKIKLS